MNFLLGNSVDSVDKLQSELEELNNNAGNISNMIDDLLNKIIQFGVNLVIAIIIFVVGRYLIKFTRRFFKKLFFKSNVDEGVIKFADSIIKVCGYLLLAVIICSQIGIQTTSFITVLGTAGLSIGLALQGSLSNFAGGVLILVSRPFKMGDYVKINEVEGVVSKIDIVYTTLTKYDNCIIKLPNGEVANSIITNFTNMNGRRVDVKFSIHYESDIKKAKEIARHVIDNCEYTVANDGNDVVVVKLAESGVELETRAWVNQEDYWKAYYYITETIKFELENNGIVIPYNQLEVHLNKGE